MKTKSVVVGVVLFALLAGVAQAQGVTLRYKYTAGAVDNYAMKGALEGQMQTPDQGNMPMSLTLNGGLTVKTTAVKDGVASQETTLGRMDITTSIMNMQVQMTFESGKLTVLLNGQPMEMPAGMPGLDMFGKPFKSRVDAQGRVLEADLGAASEMFGGFDPASLQEAGVVFPDGPVAAGDTWSNSLKIPMTMMGQKIELVLNFTYKFVGTEQYKGVDVARIELQGTADFRGTASGAIQSMQQNFKGFELFDYAAGRTPYSRFRMDQAITMAGAEGQPGGTMNIGGDIEIVLQ